jgi:hypothetical protein
MYCTAVLDLVRTAVEPNTTMHLYSCAYATVAAAAACLQACWLLLHAARLRLLYGMQRRRRTRAMAGPENPIYEYM